MASSSRPMPLLRKWMQVCKFRPSCSISKQRASCKLAPLTPELYLNATDIRYHRKSKDLPQLSSLGHFLKGSSATLGLNKVKDACEKIQNFGAFKDETGTTDVPDEEKCLVSIEDTLVDVKKDYAAAEKVLKKFYKDT